MSDKDLLKIIIILLVVIFIIPAICFVCYLVFVLSSWTIHNSVSEMSEYTPSFTSEYGKEVDMEVVQVEDEVFVYVHRERTGVDTLSEFNKKYEIIQFSNNGSFLMTPEFEVSANEEYLTLGYENWQNVNCLTVFEDTMPVNFAVGRIFRSFPSPSEAWMCSEIDINVYPELVAN